MEKFNFYVVVKNEEEYNNAVLLIEKLSKDIKWISGDAPSNISASNIPYLTPGEDMFCLNVRNNILAYSKEPFQFTTFSQRTLKQLREMVVKSISFKIDMKGDYDSLVPALEVLGIKWANGMAPSKFVPELRYLYCNKGVLYQTSNPEYVEIITAKELFEMVGLTYEEEDSQKKENEFTFLKWYYDENTTKDTLYHLFHTTELPMILECYSETEILEKVAKAKSFCSGMKVVCNDGTEGFIVNPMDDKFGILTKNGYMEIEKNETKTTGICIPVTKIYDLIEDKLL